MKALFQGAPYVVAAGLLLGAALEPQLAISDGGPQMQMGASARRDAADVSWTAGYSGPVPDYVLGTDWTHPAAYAEAAYPAAPEPDLYLPIEDEAAPPEPVRGAEPLTVATIAAPPRYPSEGGEVVVSHAPTAPEPEPQQLVEAYPPV